MGDTQAIADESSAENQNERQHEGQSEGPSEGIVGATQSQETLDRVSSFRVTYVSIILFLFLYLFTVQVFQQFLQLNFERVVAESIDIEASATSPGQIIFRNLRSDVYSSAWVNLWKAKVAVVVLARDGETWLYVDGRARVPRYLDSSPEAKTAIHLELLPATAKVTTTVEHNTMLSNTILILYSIILFTGLFAYNNRVIALENTVLDEALEARNKASSRAQQIENEIRSVRAQLRQVEPAEQEHREQIERLQHEQQSLRDQLDVLARQEREVRNRADRATTLEEEGQALEELLEEATDDLGIKNEEIRELEKNLKRVSKIAGAGGGKSRESEVLARRMRTLYPNLEIDDRAIDDMIALQDDITKLRAEECIKKLGEDAGNVGVRRKVGGLPNHLSVYELGFAGKRRIYYTKNSKANQAQRGLFRVLVVGAKNSQQNDLDYISRLPKSDFS